MIYFQLTSSSPEALNASLGEIRKVVHLNDVIPSSELINGLGTNLASDIEPFSQDRYITYNGFVPRGRKRSRSMISMTAFGTSSIYTSSCDSNQLTDTEKPDLTLVTSKHPRIVVIYLLSNLFFTNAIYLRISLFISEMKFIFWIRLGVGLIFSIHHISF